MNSLTYSILFVIILFVIFFEIRDRKYKKLEKDVLNELGFSDWNIISGVDEHVTVKSRQAFEKYDDIKFFKENHEKVLKVEDTLKRKKEISKILNSFLKNNNYKKHPLYYRIEKK